ncbi:MAG: twin-arginine translocase TatA/TatE family subunit [Planctomycetia bacterium]
MHQAFFAPFAIMGLGTVELLVVGGVVLLLFGSRLPKVMRSLGQGIVEFKRGVQGIEEDAHASSASDGDRAPGGR